MRNVLLTGCIIGLLSGGWLLVLYLAGYLTFLTDLVSLLAFAKPLRQVPLLAAAALWIPAGGLYFGLRNYKRIHDGKFTFRAALTAGLKIIMVAGALALLFALVYWRTAVHGAVNEFAGLAVAALLAGLALAVTIALVLKDK
ncbi:MAG TPA: DUF4199 family protein [Mucilaginibacter sp.]